MCLGQIKIEWRSTIFDTFWHNYHHHRGMGLFWRKEYKQDCEQTNDFKAFAFCPWSYLSPHQSDILLLHQVYSFVSDVRRALSLLEGAHQQLLRRRKQWILALRPGQHQSAGRVAILQKDFYNKVTWDDIHRTPGIPRHRPGQFIIRQILCCGRWLFSWIIFTCTLLCSIVVIKPKIGSGTLKVTNWLWNFISYEKDKIIFKD